MTGDLARLLERLYGCVCYAGIDIDPELKYPKGAARVTFATTAAFIAAINGRFVNIICGGITKRVNIFEEYLSFSIKFSQIFIFTLDFHFSILINYQNFPIS